ncbi:hypothetical protein C0995_013629, partial [Termitomyces sp. Mi166
MPLLTRQATCEQKHLALPPGALPTTPLPSGAPWTDFRTPKEEPSPMPSEAEALADLMPLPSSSSTESLNSSGSSSSEDDFTPSHQNNPTTRTIDTHHTANQNHMSATLVFNPDTDDQRPLAKVRITKLRECPMLTEGHMDDHVFQQWTIACRRYQKHSGKKDSEIVSFVADGMLEPCFVAWYHANQSRIDSMTLDQYLGELQRFALPCRWQSKVCDTILESYQGNMSFADWVVVLQNLNACLKNTSSEHTLSETSFKAHLKSHMRPELRRKVDYKRISAGELADWITEVTELDKELAEERARTQAMIDVSNERISKRKPLIERLSEPSSRASSTSLTPSGTVTPRIKLAKLTDEEKKLLAEHQ